MSFALIISSPNVIPFARQISATTTAEAIKTVEKMQDENFAESMLMLVDYGNARIYRVINSEQGFQLADNADKFIGVNTRP